MRRMGNVFFDGSRSTSVMIEEFSGGRMMKWAHPVGSLCRWARVSAEWEEEEETVGAEKGKATETETETAYQRRYWYLCLRAGVRRSAVEGIQLMAARM